MPESKKNLEQNLSNVTRKIKAIGGKNVRFIILYGSVAKGKLTKISDVDIAVFYYGDKVDRFEFRKQILGRVSDEFDIQIFQDLPLYIQKDILSSGKIIYYADYKETFDIFMRTIRRFEDFKPRLEIYYSGLRV